MLHNSSILPPPTPQTSLPAHHGLHGLQCGQDFLALRQHPLQRVHLDGEQAACSDVPEEAQLELAAAEEQGSRAMGVSEREGNERAMEMHAQCTKHKRVCAWWTGPRT